MKLTTVAVFGVGYLLGTRAGRERYEQILELAHDRQREVRGVRCPSEAGGVRRPAGGLRGPVPGGPVPGGPVPGGAVGWGPVPWGPVPARSGGGKRWPDPVVIRCDRSGARPERTPRSFRLHRPSRYGSREHLARVDPARGDMVIGAFVLARLLGLRLLTLEAQVVVHDDDGDAAGSGPLVLAQLAPDAGLSPARLTTRSHPAGRAWRAADPTRWPARCSWWNRAPTRSSGPGGASTEADRAWEAPAQA